MKNVIYMPLNLFFFQIQIINMDSKLHSILIHDAYYGTNAIFSVFHYLLVNKQFLAQQQNNVKDF